MSAHRQRAGHVPASGPFPVAGLSASARIAIWLATSGGIGYAAKAPGTWGSLPGLLIAIALQHYVGAQPWTIGLCLGLLTVLAAWSIDRTETALQVHDDGRIVIDEVVGQAIALAFLPVTAGTILAAFGLFRLLDITKPLAIGWIDRHAPGWIGTLADDVLAGIVAALILLAALASLPL